MEESGATNPKYQPLAVFVCPVDLEEPSLAIAWCPFTHLLD